MSGSRDLGSEFCTVHVFYGYNLPKIQLSKKQCILEMSWSKKRTINL